MTKENKADFLRFVTRTGMYITVQDKSNVMSFVTGYEVGTRCDFTKLFEDFITMSYDISTGATSWWGQLDYLSKALSQSWMQTFKQVCLRFITSDDDDLLSEELNETVRARLHALLKQISAEGHPYFNLQWVEEWQSLCASECEWFKGLWSKDQLKVILSINDLINSGQAFADIDQKLASQELLRFAERIND